MLQIGATVRTRWIWVWHIFSWLALFLLKNKNVYLKVIKVLKSVNKMVTFSVFFLNKVVKTLRRTCDTYCVPFPSVWDYKASGRYGPLTVIVRVKLHHDEVTNLSSFCGLFLLNHVSWSWCKLVNFIFGEVAHVQSTRFRSWIKLDNSTQK